MYGGSLGVISNMADWSDSGQIDDDETGDPLDLTGATITMTVETQMRSPVLMGTTTNGEITIPALGVFEWNFPASVMSGISDQTYRVGIRIERDGPTLQLFLGFITIEDGI